ncbi:CMRF35-like molecule 1 [Seriola aureovittata]|uniref:CMRF35-like molecule 1 n=1 Tax=Seriola aureovittata TaxID=2871759 RepID=UPI0024BDC975|nr:CMRF35-like molecule 1 [Seriola aureovittata]
MQFCRLFGREIRVEIRKDKGESEKRMNPMSSMEMIFIILVFLEGGLWEAEAMSLTGVLHKDITIECSHGNAFSNIKYFCKGACNNEDVLITSREQNKGSWSKYSIKDEGNTFFVTISRLTEDDAGTYWCGIERVGFDTYNEVILTVIKKEGNSADLLQLNSEKLVYIGAGLGVLVLALAMVLLIFFRYRNRDASSGKDHDTVYATPSSLNQDAQHITTSSSAAQHQDASRDPTDSSSISSDVQNQPVGLFYSTVSFNKHTDCSTATPRPAEVTYSTIAAMSTDESAVFCND